MNITLSRTQAILKCDECGENIEQFAPYWSLEFDSVFKDITLCEDCGNHLNNDMDDEYSEFVDMGK